MASWLDRLQKDPIPWILDKACPSLRYRTLTEIIGRDPDDAEVRAAREASANYKPPVTISRLQKENGTWLDKIVEFETPNPSRNRGPGLINQYLALVEYGWDRFHPIIHCSGDVLRRYAGGDPTADLYELKGYAGANPVINEAIRADLSLMALAALSRSGYEEEPEVVRKAQELFETLSEQYPEGGEPSFYGDLIEIPEDRSYRMVKSGCFAPEMFLFYAMAFHPRFREDDAAPLVRRVVDHLMAGWEVPDLIREVEGKHYLKYRILTIGFMEREQFAEGRVGYLLHDLELLARLGVLPDIPKAMDLLEWLISAQDLESEEGMIRLDEEIEKRVSRSLYHFFPLEDSWRGKHKKYTDLTFRVALILKTLDRTAPLS